MKLVSEETIFERGSFPRSQLWKQAQQDVRDGISRVVWPARSSTFKIRAGKNVNGVRPIRNACVKHLRAQGWRTETLPELLEHVLTRRDFDALLSARDRHVALEWETGNISSSHRSVNKLLVGFDRERIQGAILVLPSRDLYRHLTDRVGNFEELGPYLDLWKRAPVRNGAFKMFVVEHDELSSRVKAIPKGTDGWHRAAALRAVGR